MQDHPLKTYRLARGLTQTALAEQLGVTKVSISRWEKRTRFPRRTDVAVIVEKTGLTPTEILGLDLVEAAE